jgi:hypothetical protein
MRQLSYWIKERHNPQFDKPYYMAKGQLTKAAAKRMEDSLYGFNVMLEYPTKKAYEEALIDLRSKGFAVR